MEQSNLTKQLEDVNAGHANPVPTAAYQIVREDY